MNYYQRIRDVREDHDLKQKDLAEILGTTQAMIWKYESGVTRMGIDKYIRMAQYFNISLDFLTGLTDEPRPLR